MLEILKSLLEVSPLWPINDNLAFLHRLINSPQSFYIQPLCDAEFPYPLKSSNALTFAFRFPIDTHASLHLPVPETADKHINYFSRLLLPRLHSPFSCHRPYFEHHFRHHPYRYCCFFVASKNAHHDCRPVGHVHHHHQDYRLD